ncbi:MAG: hypothetical protein AVDCRST_MAG20-1620 [uncultured Acidimicrobiales bacterium]|uniref:Uncharacterized protein n=1 Tax=uncultured Acidimicrobiales bacterium TaxID=310071 RepID=A0A6J4I0C1_9ACTN|nr:MAG: hypothetical protein AVDCRST_MAG20-1620 [uncultured Acidimicrobiales bacterium]
MDHGAAGPDGDGVSVFTVADDGDLLDLVRWRAGDEARSAEVRGREALHLLHQGLRPDSPLSYVIGSARADVSQVRLTLADGSAVDAALSDVASTGTRFYVVVLDEAGEGREAVAYDDAGDVLGRAGVPGEATETGTPTETETEEPEPSDARKTETETEED